VRTLSLPVKLHVHGSFALASSHTAQTPISSRSADCALIPSPLAVIPLKYLPGNSRVHDCSPDSTPAQIHSHNSSNPINEQTVPGDAEPDEATPDDVSSEDTTQTMAQARATSHHDGHFILADVSGTIDVTDAGLHGPLSLPPRGSDS
jgi:hypothetical protein